MISFDKMAAKAQVFFRIITQTHLHTFVTVAIDLQGCFELLNEESLCPRCPASSIQLDWPNPVDLSSRFLTS